MFDVGTPKRCTTAGVVLDCAGEYGIGRDILWDEQRRREDKTLLLPNIYVLGNEIPDFRI